MSTNLTLVTASPDTVQARASLHEKAVQKIARHEHDVPRRRRTRGAAKSSRVTLIQARLEEALDEPVRSEVLSLEPDRSCVQVISRTDVVVWNHPAPWPGVR